MACDFKSPTQLKKPSAFCNSTVKPFKGAAEEEDLARHNTVAPQGPSLSTSKWRAGAGGKDHIPQLQDLYLWIQTIF